MDIFDMHSIIDRLNVIEEKIGAENLDAILLTVLPPTTIYIDGNRTDTYVEQGSETKPFKTINAGVNKVTSYGDLNRSYNLKITMANYNEVITIPVGVHNICFDADGIKNVKVNGLRVIDHASLNNCIFKNIVFDGDVNLQNIVSDKIIFYNCEFNYIMNYNIGSVYYDNCYFRSNVFNIFNCSIVGIHNSTVWSDINIRTDENSPVPKNWMLGTRVVFENCRINGDAEFILTNIIEFTGTELELLNCVIGISGMDIPNDATLIAWNSCLGGVYSGHRTLYNSVIVP